MKEFISEKQMILALEERGIYIENIPRAFISFNGFLQETSIRDAYEKYFNNHPDYFTFVDQIDKKKCM